MVYIGFTLIFIGLFFIISGMIALFRFPDFFTKLHGASVIDCAGIPICLFGLALIQSEFISSLKLILIIVIILILNPVSSHALARGAMDEKIDSKGRIR